MEHQEHVASVNKILMIDDSSANAKDLLFHELICVVLADSQLFGEACGCASAFTQAQ